MPSSSSIVSGRVPCSSGRGSSAVTSAVTMSSRGSRRRSSSSACMNRWSPRMPCWASIRRSSSRRAPMDAVVSSDQRLMSASWPGDRFRALTITRTGTGVAKTVLKLTTPSSMKLSISSSTIASTAGLERADRPGVERFRHGLPVAGVIRRVDRQHRRRAVPALPTDGLEALDQVGCRRLVRRRPVRRGERGRVAEDGRGEVVSSDEMEVAAGQVPSRRRLAHRCVVRERVLLELVAERVEAFEHRGGHCRALGVRRVDSGVMAVTTRAR